MKIQGFAFNNTNAQRLIQEWIVAKYLHEEKEKILEQIQTKVKTLPPGKVTYNPDGTMKIPEITGNIFNITAE